jgi:pumilio RNA-binding family
MKDGIGLIKDQFGNYVFQKVFEVGMNKHKKKILELIKGRVVELSYNTFGCRVVQKGLEYIRNLYEEQDHFIN